MKNLVIIGAGGFGRELVEYIRVMNEKQPTWNFLGFIDDQATSTPEGYAVLGDLEYLLMMENKPCYCISIADSEARERIAKRCKGAGLQAETIIDPKATIGPNCVVGEGSIICGDWFLTTNVQVGEFCILNGGGSLGHDLVIDDFNTMMADPYFGGQSYIGKHNYFGLRCTIINGIKTTDHCTFGACACVIKDATEPGTYVGVPAKLVKPLKR